MMKSGFSINFQEEMEKEIQASKLTEKDWPDLERNRKDLPGTLWFKNPQPK